MDHRPPYPPNPYPPRLRCLAMDRRPPYPPNPYPPRIRCLADLLRFRVPRALMPRINSLRMPRPLPQTQGG